MQVTVECFLGLVFTCVQVTAERFLGLGFYLCASNSRTLSGLGFYLCASYSQMLSGAGFVPVCKEQLNAFWDGVFACVQVTAKCLVCPGYLY